MADINTEKIYGDFVKAAESMKACVIQLADAVQNLAKVIRKMRMEYILNDPEIRAADQREAAEMPEVRAEGRAGGHEPGIL